MGILGGQEAIEVLFKQNLFDAAVVSVSTSIAFRRDMANKLRQLKIPMANVIDPSARVQRNAALGVGNVILSYCHIGACTSIGDGNFLSPYVDVEHHCEVGDFCTFGPGSNDEFTGQNRSGGEVWNGNIHRTEVVYRIRQYHRLRSHSHPGYSPEFHRQDEGQLLSSITSLAPLRKPGQSGDKTRRHEVFPKTIVAEDPSEVLRHREGLCKFAMSIFNNVSDNVPFLDLITPHLELEQELTDVFRRALLTAGFIGGPMVEEFEEAFAAFCGTKQSIAVSSGTDALRFAIMACGVQARRRGTALCRIRSSPPRKLSRRPALCRNSSTSMSAPTICP